MEVVMVGRPVAAVHLHLVYLEADKARLLQ